MVKEKPDMAKTILLNRIFAKPAIVGIVADVNQGKTNTALWLLHECKRRGASVYAYSFPDMDGVHRISSLRELELCHDSIVFIDEFTSLFDVENRKNRRLIEKTLRLIHHRNNILVLCGVCENYKKFISSKVNIWLFKTCTIDDFINGSSAKRICTSYAGDGSGSNLLYVSVENALCYDGEAFTIVKIPYIKEHDTKRKNKPLVGRVKK